MIMAQNKSEIVNCSGLLGIVLPSEAICDKKIINVAAAKSTLEMEALSPSIDIMEVEILTYFNQSEIKEDAKKWLESVYSILMNDQYEVILSENDPSFYWLSKEDHYYLMYTSASKKQANIYIGKVNKLPEQYSNIHQQNTNTTTQILSDNSPVVSTKSNQNAMMIQKEPLISTDKNILSELVGSWGNLAGAKVNWRDESTGYQLVSGVSKGYGLELKPDGTFIHSTVVTSGRPNYRVFVSTIGVWSVNADQLIFEPTDRHYRKWENEITMIDEHSVPDGYIRFWKMAINDITGKECLFIKYELQQDQWDELCRE